MRKTGIILSALCTALMAAACVEDYSPTINSADGHKIIVDALLTTDTTAHCVKITTSAPYGTASEDIPAVSGARVTITGPDGTVELKEDGTTGRYYTPEDYSGKEGQEYKLVVDAVDDGSPVHFEASDIMPPSGVRADGFDYYKMADSLWSFAIWGQDLPGIVSHYAADLCVHGRKHDFGKWVFIDGYQMFDGNYLNGGEYLFYSCFDILQDEDEPLTPLVEGDVVTMYFYSMSDFFYSYITAVLNESMAHFPMFSAQPANLPTNISGGAMGCFALAHLTKMDVVIDDPERTRIDMLRDHNMLIWSPASGSDAPAPPLPLP